GQIAETIWHEIPTQFPYAESGNFMVTPNHIYRILILNKPSDQQQHHQKKPPQIKSGGFAGNKNPMLHDNVSRIIRWYKGRCSFEIRKIQVNFAWQSRFHDHIIRNEVEYQHIANYIINNPNNWTNDKFFNP
ncbi:MAG: hypothetical protein WCR58_08210, partial [Bacteroidales bacterium]